MKDTAYLAKGSEFTTPAFELGRTGETQTVHVVTNDSEHGVSGVVTANDVLLVSSESLVYHLEDSEVMP